MARGSLGEFEHLILLAVYRLGPSTYGVPIIQEVEVRTGRSVTQAAAYLTLRRLEEKGFIKSKLGKPTAERGGRAKRFFEITRAGTAQLRESRTALAKMWDGVSPELDRV
ncbi:PadR family transcriptional regulator [Gemmatimonadota bacterium]